MEHIHGSYHALHCHENILIDEFDETSLVLVRVTGSVNNTHLFDECRFTRLSRTCNNNSFCLFFYQIIKKIN